MCSSGEKYLNEDTQISSVIKQWINSFSMSSSESEPEYSLKCGGSFKI
jgi:hypothetical protein